MQSKLKKILTKYTEEEKQLKNTYNKKSSLVSLYKKLFEYLKEGIDSININKAYIITLLDTIYDDNIRSNEFNYLLELYESNLDIKSEYKSFLTRITSDYKDLLTEIESLKNRLDRNRYAFDNARKARLSLQHKLPIELNEHMTNDIKRIISYYELSGELSSKEALMCINDLEYYNRNIASNKKKDIYEIEYEEGTYEEIPNILNSGYEIFELPEVNQDRVVSLDKYVKEIIEIINYTDKDKVIELIENYRNYGLEESEYNYIITKILNSYNEELITYYELLLDRDIFYDKKNRNEIIKSYYQCLNKYLLLRAYYDDMINIDIEEDITTNEEEEIRDIKRLIYSSSLANPTKARILKDMESIPNEYYSTVLSLLTSFKNGTIAKNEVKCLTNNKRMVLFMELKSDQVRIVIKHVKDNIYNVVGVFAKKSDNDMTMYRTMRNRLIPDTSSEDKLNKQLCLATYTEEELERIVLEKGRKSSR